MALSLSSSITTTTTTVFTHSQIGKPSPFSTRSTPTQRFIVSCNVENGEETPQASGVERRNLLLGLGGLYGAANLVQLPAMATPISSPDLSRCSLSTNLNTQQPLDVNCCPPPPSDQIIDYKLPHFSKLRLRPAAHLVSKEYIVKYEKATELMKALPDDDPRSFMQQANVHCAYCNLTYDQTGAPDEKLQIHN